MCSMRAPDNPGGWEEPRDSGDGFGECRICGAEISDVGMPQHLIGHVDDGGDDE